MASMTHSPSALEDPNGPLANSSTNKAPLRSYRTAWMYLFDWYPSYYSPVEKRMLRKLDIVLLTFGCLALFIKTLDTSNLHNAYVSGMKEDLELNGNQYSLFTTFYDVGYLFCQVPSLMLLSRPSLARYFIPSMEVLWSILTLAQSQIRGEASIYGTRFLLGVLETPVSSGLFFVLSSWYRPSELFKRAGVWYISSSLGSMFSHYLQAAAYIKLNDVGGMPGWRWLFIIDGCISLPIAFLGFALFPGLPSSAKPWWMTKDEHDLSRTRMVDEGVAKSKPIGWALLKRVFTKWHFYIAVLLYTFYLSSCYPASHMSLWLKDETKKHHHHYTVPQINILPTGVQAVSIVITILCTSLCMIYPLWAIITAVQIVTMFATIILLIWDVPRALHFVASYLLGFSTSLTPVIIPWVNIIMKDDAEARAFTTGAMITFAYSLNTFYPITVFPVLQAPRWKRGYSVTIVFITIVWTIFMTGHLLHRRDSKKAEAMKLVVDEENLSEEEVKVEDKVDAKVSHVEIKEVVP